MFPIWSAWASDSSYSDLCGGLVRPPQSKFSDRLCNNQGLEAGESFAFDSSDHGFPRFHCGLVDIMLTRR